jgi:Family of unknown function (DUF6624)
MLAAACTSTPPARQPSLRERLAGAWQQADGNQVLCFDGDRCVFAVKGNQTLFTVAYDDGRIHRTPANNGVQLDEQVTFRDGGMTLTYPGGRHVMYTRLPSVPEDARVDPLPLGSRAPGKDEIAQLTAELRQRTERDQGVRKEYEALAHPGQGRQEDKQAMNEVLQRMEEIDFDNTHRLIAMVRDVGWIDPVRFSERANADAFLLVQHSGNLALMQAALPLLEEEVKDHPRIGQYFALLYDRTQLALGRAQRYGTQLHSGPDKVLHVHRLADQAGVDARRKSVGLGPLAGYLEFWRKQGDTVVVDPFP